MDKLNLVNPFHKQNACKVSQWIIVSTVCIAILQVDQHTEQATDEYHSAVQSTYSSVIHTCRFV